MLTGKYRRIIATMMAPLYLATNVSLLQANEANVWADRHRSNAAPIQLASLPTTMPTPASIFRTLPLTLDRAPQALSRTGHTLSPDVAALAAALPERFGTIRSIQGGR